MRRLLPKTTKRRRMIDVGSVSEVYDVRSARFVSLIKKSVQS